jgi:septum formation protein
VIYLASQSPQRAQLLEQAGLRFQVVPSTGDEERVQLPHPQALALERARVKAEGAQVPPGADGVILAADTVVAVGGRLYGKPTDDADAARILTALSGTTHHVITGHCCLRVCADGSRGPAACGVAMAAVTMRQLVPEEIQAYLATGEHRGRAGAYAMQESGDRFVVDVQGAKGTVIGLTLDTVQRLYRELVGCLPETLV